MSPRPTIDRSESVDVGGKSFCFVGCLDSNNLNYFNLFKATTSVSKSDNSTARDLDHTVLTSCIHLELLYQMRVFTARQY